VRRRAEEDKRTNKQLRGIAQVEKISHAYQVGQRVMWSGSWGTEPPKPATIIDLAEKNERPIYDLDNGYWCYEYQLQTIDADFPQGVAA
jgi:hypothetical protein